MKSIVKAQEYKALTPSERRDLRNQYIAAQGGLRHYCNAELANGPRSDIAVKTVKKSLFPPSFFQYPVHLHHCHKTGLTIGAVHNHCNAVLWQYYGE